MNNLRMDYPYNEALDDLRQFIERIVVHEDEKCEFMKVIERARVRKTVPMRGVHSDIMAYRKKYKLYTPFSDSERQMIDELIQFWT